MPDDHKNPENFPELVYAESVDEWGGPIPPERSGEIIRALESGKIVYLPQLRFEIEEEERAHVFRDWADEGSKNISYEAKLGKLTGVVEETLDTSTIQNMMSRFATASTELAAALLAPYGPHVALARTSFRPAEIVGRELGDRKDDRRLHVDAFPSRPTRGDRILRIFSNINPQGRPRTWRVGEPFEAFARTMLPRVPNVVPGTGLVRAALGKRHRTRYDHTMLHLHDLAKVDDDYQQNNVVAEIDFPANATWLVFTDQVLHAAIAGSYVLEQTFHLPVNVQQLPESSPLQVLERLSDRRLA